MITSIDIQGFRGIRSGKLEGLTPLVVLVGPNSSGKSTVLDALLIAGSPLPAKAILHAATRREGIKQGGRWLFPHGDETASAELRLTTSRAESRVCQLSIGQPVQGNSMNIECQVQDTDATAQHSRQTHSAYTNGSFTGALQPLAGVPEIRVIEAHAPAQQTPLHRLVTRLAETGRRTQARDLVQRIAPAVQGIEILAEGDSPLVYLEYRDGSIPVAMAGDGVQALVRLSLELATCAGGVVLLEEPETHEHPAAIQLTARAIMAAVRHDVQVILSTHSLELIDALLGATEGDDELALLSLYRLKLEGGALISSRLTGDLVAVGRNEIEDDLR